MAVLIGGPLHLAQQIIFFGLMLLQEGQVQSQPVDDEENALLEAIMLGCTTARRIRIGSSF